MKMRPGGISKKTGKSYPEFWACPEKNADGSFCKYKPPKATTPEQKFDENLAKSGAANDQYKKDNTITRLAIAKSMIESGTKFSLDSVKEAENWVLWAEGTHPLAKGIKTSVALQSAPRVETEPMTNAALVPAVAPDETIDLSEIPF